MKKLFLIAMKFIKLNFIWRLKREKFINNNRKKFHFVNAPTIITNNCVGGLMYHELGTKFTSPIINLFMDCEDFIKFCENIEYYLKLDLIKSEHSAEWHLKHKNIEADDNGYPVALLGDLTLFLVHYKTFEEGRNKWNERKQRVQFDNIRIIGSERDGCTE